MPDTISGVANDPDTTYDFLMRPHKFLTRAYKVVRLIAITSVSFAGILVAIITLDIKVSHLWTDLKVPLYLLALIGLPVAAVYGVIVLTLVLLLKGWAEQSVLFQNWNEVEMPGVEPGSFEQKIVEGARQLFRRTKPHAV